jgi:hypothetical protein
MLVAIFFIDQFFAKIMQNYEFKSTTEQNVLEALGSNETFPNYLLPSRLHKLQTFCTVSQFQTTL